MKLGAIEGACDGVGISVDVPSALLRLSRRSAAWIGAPSIFQSLSSGDGFSRLVISPQSRPIRSVGA